MVGKLGIDIAASGKRLFEGVGDFLAHKMKANGTTSKQVDAKPKLLTELNVVFNKFSA